MALEQIHTWELIIEWQRAFSKAPISRKRQENGYEAICTVFGAIPK